MVSAKASFSLIIIAIIIFIVIHSVQTYYNLQDMKYYEDKVTEAQSRLDAIENTGFFILPSSAFAEQYFFVTCPNDNLNINYTYSEGTDCTDIQGNLEPHNKKD
jgi:hypothetical protein